MAPGFYNADEGANHGPHTTGFLESFWADYAILSASGLTPEGPSDALIDAGEVYSKMITRSFKTIIAADKSKFGLKFPAQYALWKDVDYLVTDRAPDKALVEELDKNEIEIQLVTPGHV